MNNAIQKVVDAGLLLLAAALIIGVIVGFANPHPAAAEPTTLAAFNYTPGYFLLGNDVGKGPKWDDLKAMTANLR